MGSKYYYFLLYDEITKVKVSERRGGMGWDGMGWDDWDWGIGGDGRCH